MGYTHYFEAKNENYPTDEEWEKLAEKAADIFQEHKDILCFEYNEPERPPIVRDCEIRFNGKGYEGHETFLLRRDQDGFEFCKTARKPYDIAVFKVLKAAKEICPNWLELYSDARDGGKTFNLTPEKYAKKELCY